MDLEKVFDMVCHMRDSETVGTDYQMGKIKLNPEQQETVLRKSIQCFVHEPARIIDPNKKTAIQAFSGSSDLPELTKDVFNVTQPIPEYDLYWQEAFKGIPLKKGQLSWEIADVSSGVSFVLIPEGQKINYEGISGSKVIVEIAKYGAGLGITWETIEGRKLYKFIDQMEWMRSELYNTWADVHYALLATAGATNQIAYDLVGSNVLEKDINSINAVLDALATDNKDSGYGNPNSFQYKMYAPSALETRFERAFKVSQNDLSNTSLAGNTIKKRSVSRFYTYNDNVAADTALFVVPGNKIQNAVYMREMGLSRQEIESLNELRTYWTAFGATVADNDQVYELATA